MKILTPDTAKDGDKDLGKPAAIGLENPRMLAIQAIPMKFSNPNAESACHPFLSTCHIMSAV